MEEIEKCSDCIKDNGVFNAGKPCCAERHFRMTLRVCMSEVVNKELAAIRSKFGDILANFLAELSPPRRSKVVSPKASNIPASSQLF